MQQNANTGSFATPYKFNAKELDLETGNYYYGARYYNPQVSVWLGVDPLAMYDKNKSMSPYQFTDNNPVMLVDPNGTIAGGPEKGDPIKVAIDAGHGIDGSNNPSMDPGAVDNGHNESDIALDISRVVNLYINIWGDEGLMIRDGELTVEGNSLKYRSDKAKAGGADLFVSIHINSAGENKDASGFTVCYKSNGTNGEENRSLAESISNNQTVMAVRGSGVTERNNLSVLNEFSSTGPAVLIEVGFISNYSDVIQMTTKTHQIGLEIARGIYMYTHGGNPPPIVQVIPGLGFF